MRNKSTYIWNFAGRFLSQIIYIVASVVLARYLTPDDFGEIGVLTIFISISSTISESGFGGSLIKEHQIEIIDCSTVFTFNAVVSLGLYLILFIAAPYIAEIYKIEDLTLVTRLVSLVFVINAFGIVPRTLLTRKLKFKTLAIISTICVFCASSIAIIGSMLGWGVYALVAYQLSSALLSVVFYHLNCKQRMSFGFSKKSFHKLFSFGAYTTFCNVIDTAYNNILASFFGKFMSISTAGYYFQAQKIETASTSAVTLTVNNVSFPILTRLRDDKISFLKESNSLLKYIVTLIFPIFVFVIVYTKPIILLLFGEKWLPSEIFLKILIIAGVFIVIESLIRNNIKSLGEVRRLFIINLIKQSVFIVLLLISGLINPISMLYVYLACCMIGSLINIWLYCDIIEFSKVKFISYIFKLLVVPSVLVPILYAIVFLTNNELFPNLLLSLLIYISYYLLVSYRILHVNTIDFVKSKLKKFKLEK